MKYKSTLKGVGLALRRMTNSGHLCQKVRGRYTITKLGQTITHLSKRFDRRICVQKYRYAYRRRLDRRMRRKKKGKCRRSRRRCSKKRKRRCAKKRRRRCPPKPRCPK